MLKLKKSAAYLLSILIILSTALALPFTASAAEVEDVEVSAGTTGDCAWSKNGVDTLVISGSGRMADYDIDYENSQFETPPYKIKYTYPWSAPRIKHIIIEEGVTYIGSYAFASFPALESVTFPSSLEEIGEGSFSDCGKLKSITLPEGLKAVGNYAFASLGSLESISIPSTLERYGFDAFAFNENLKNIEFADGLTVIGDSAFEFCEALESVTIPGSVTKIGSTAFACCSKLEEINLPDDLAEIDSYAFHGTAWYENQPDGLVYIGKVAYFYKGDIACPSVIEIKPGTVMISPYIFQDCVTLTKVILPDSVETIGEYAFTQCTKLSDINFSDNIKKVGVNALLDTLWYENQPDGLVYIGNVLYSVKGDSYPRAITVSDGTVSVTGFAFSEAENVSSVKLPDSVESIGIGAFLYCTKLRSVKLPANIKIIEAFTFESCGLLKKITIPDGVKTIDWWAFSNCINLEQIIIPESVDYIDPSAFDGCEKVTIYGYAGSYAEEYANENEIPFVALERAKQTGDINGDNVVDIMDSIIVQKYAAGKQILDAEQLALADVNADGTVDILDAMDIQKFASGKITEFKKSA